MHRLAQINALVHCLFMLFALPVGAVALLYSGKWLATQGLYLLKFTRVYAGYGCVSSMFQNFVFKHFLQRIDVRFLS